MVSLKRPLLIGLAAAGLIALFWGTWPVKTLPSDDSFLTDFGYSPQPPTQTDREPRVPMAGWQRSLTTVTGEDVLPPDLPEHHHVKRSWTGRLEPNLGALGEAWRNGNLTDGFTMPLFEGREAHILVTDYQDAGPRRGVILGRVEGFPGSLVSLAHVGLAESGTIQIPTLGEVYEIRPGPDGTVILSEIDVAALGECATCAAGLAH